MSEVESCSVCGGPVVSYIHEGYLNSWHTVDWQCDCTKIKYPPKYLDKMFEQLKEIMDERTNEKDNQNS